MDTINQLTGFIAVAGFFTAIVLSLYFFFRVRNKERMAMIEKGMAIPIKPKQTKPIKTLKVGIFLIGIGLGIFFGHIIGKYTTIDEVVSFFVMILLFGGIALSLSYIIELKFTKRED